MWRNCSKCWTLFWEKPGKEMQGLSSLTSILISIDLRTGLKLKKQVCEVRRTLLSRRRITFPVLSSSISSWLGRTRWREDSPDLFKLTAISVSFVFNEVTPGKTKTLNRKTTATYLFFQVGADNTIRNMTQEHHECCLLFSQLYLIVHISLSPPANMSGDGSSPKLRQ